MSLKSQKVDQTQRVSIFAQVPWVGGVNNSIDPSMIPPNQLTQCDHLQFDTRGSRQKRDGINYNWDGISAGSTTIIGGFDFWYGNNNNRNQNIVAVDSAATFYSYAPGNPPVSASRSTLTFASTATAWSSLPTRVNFSAMNNALIIAGNGPSGNVPKKWVGSASTVLDLGGSPPNFTMMSQHLGRLWVNDPANPDRLNYSPTGDIESWNGVGDSGALDIGLGDGDPKGITAIFPSFKGVLFVAKRTKLYRIDGLNPESFQVTLVSKGIGCVNHGAVCSIDEEDIFFVSDRGIHSLAATANYGDFDSTFVSEDIQRGFRDNWPAAIRPFIQSVYIPSLNSALFSTADNTVSNNQNTLWCYNIPLKAWYRWPSIECNTLFEANDTDKKRFYLGGTKSKLGQGLTGKHYDVNVSGSRTAILYTIVTGLIFPDNNPYSTKGFKRFSLLYKPSGPHTITVSLKIDNFSPQPLVFQDVSSQDLLGSTFILGQSTLGATFVMAPYTQTMDGYGRGFQMTIMEAGINETVEIQGFLVEYEVSGAQQEVRLGDAS